jgi:hypothetical protein
MLNAFETSVYLGPRGHREPWRERPFAWRRNRIIAPRWVVHATVPLHLLLNRGRGRHRTPLERRARIAAKSFHVKCMRDASRAEQRDIGDADGVETS